LQFILKDEASFQLWAAAGDGRRFRLEAADEPNFWTEQSRETAAGGKVQFNGMIDRTHRFYRVVELP